MSTLSTSLKGLAVILLIAASPIFVIFAGPFGCGIASDVLDAAGTPAALALTTTVCIGALAWVRYRGRWSRLALPRRHAARSVG